MISTLLQLIDKIDEFLARASLTLGVMAALVMLVSLLLGVFYRYVLQSAVSWSGELALLAFTWMIFLIGSAMVRNAEHVRITMLRHLLPKVAYEIVERLVLFLILVFGVAMLWYGFQYVQFTVGQVSPAMRYPLWWQNAAIPVGGALVVCHTLNKLLSPQFISANLEGGSDA